MSSGLHILCPASRCRLVLQHLLSAGIHSIDDYFMTVLASSPPPPPPPQMSRRLHIMPRLSLSPRPAAPVVVCSLLPRFAW